MENKVVTSIVYSPKKTLNILCNIFIYIRAIFHTICFSLFHEKWKAVLSTVCTTSCTNNS